MKYLLSIVISCIMISMGLSCTNVKSPTWEEKRKRAIEDEKWAKTVAGVEKLKCLEENGIFKINSRMNDWHHFPIIYSWSCEHTKEGYNKFLDWLENNDSRFNRNQ